MGSTNSMPAGKGDSSNIHPTNVFPCFSHYWHYIQASILMYFPPRALCRFSVSKTPTSEIIVISVQFRKYKLACVLNLLLGTYSQSPLSSVLLPIKMGIIKPLYPAAIWTNTWKIMRLLSYYYHGCHTNNWDRHQATLPCHFMQTMTTVLSWGLRQL